MDNTQIDSDRSECEREIKEAIKIKWRVQANQECKSFIHGICDTYFMGMEAFKKSLIHKINNEISSTFDFMEYSGVVDDGKYAALHQYKNGLEYVLGIIEQIEPYNGEEDLPY